MTLLSHSPYCTAEYAGLFSLYCTIEYVGLCASVESGVLA